MRTAYEALRRAIIKDFGKWYSLEWKAVSEEIKPKIKSGLYAEKHWTSIFLPDIENLCVGYRPGGKFFINGNLNGGFDFGETYGASVKLLYDMKVDCKYWVFSSFCFDDNFSLQGFSTKAEAIACWKKQKKREDNIFRTFWYRW